jgi:hypothetical protein
MELGVCARRREHHFDARRELEVTAQFVAHVLAAPVEGDLDLVEQRFVDQLLARQRRAVIGGLRDRRCVDEAKFQIPGSVDVPQP